MGNCQTCRFWISPSSPAAEEGKGGRCQRMPPVVVWGVDHGANQIARTEWPRTYYDDGCGEHQPSSPSKAAKALPAKPRGGKR